MAKNLGNNDKERLRRIKLVGDYVRRTHASTREAADFFSSTEFKISNFTVSDYLKRYQILFPEKGETVAKVISENKEDTLDDPKVKNRVAMGAVLYMSGLTIEEVAKRLNTTYWTAYRDLHKRLPLLSKDVYESIEARLMEEVSIMEKEKGSEEPTPHGK